jgi:transcriptional regulator with XRE-family HTH domain
MVAKGYLKAMNGEELKAWRKERGMTQQKLCTRLGVTVLAVKRWEGGHRKIPPFLHLALQAIDATLPNTERKEVKKNGLHRKKARKMGS